MNLDPSVEFGFEIEEKGATSPLIKQVHGNKAVLCGSQSVEADALYTFDNKKKIYVYTADYIPLLFYTPHPQGPIAATHAGWRGTVNGVIESTLQCLNAYQNSLKVILGPSILKCCFEVKADFIQVLESKKIKFENHIESRENRFYFDLRSYAIERLKLPKERIILDYSRCTFCSTPTLPSYRREKNTLSRIRSWIMKK